MPGMEDARCALYGYITRWVLDILSQPPQNIENLGRTPISSQELNSRKSYDA